MKNLNKIYQKGFKEEKQKRGNNVVEINMEIGGEKKTYHEKNFYYCGFSRVGFQRRGGKKLKELLEKEGYEIDRVEYWNGIKSAYYTIRLDCGGYSNGFHQLMVAGKRAVRDYLNSLDYKVEIEARLD